MSNRVFAHLNSDVPAAHLMRYGGGRCGAKKAVEYKVSMFRREMQNSLN
jgi:hypothetical protein